MICEMKMRIRSIAKSRIENIKRTEYDKINLTEFDKFSKMSKTLNFLLELGTN